MPLFPCHHLLPFGFVCPAVERGKVGFVLELENWISFIFTGVRILSTMILSQLWLEVDVLLSELSLHTAVRQHSLTVFMWHWNLGLKMEIVFELAFARTSWTQRFESETTGRSSVCQAASTTGAADPHSSLVQPWEDNHCSWHCRVIMAFDRRKHEYFNPLKGVRSMSSVESSCLNYSVWISEPIYWTFSLFTDHS